MSVAVINLNKDHRINENFVKGITLDILKIIKKPRVKIEVVFLSDSAIKKLNKIYKHSNRATDVLSFDLRPLYQILISSDMALKNSKIFKTSFEKELILYVIHGILHLFGYDDITDRDKARMSKKEFNILENLCRKVELSRVLTRQ